MFVHHCNLHSSSHLIKKHHNKNHLAKPMTKSHTNLAKVVHWSFILLYLYGIFKQVNDLDDLEDKELLVEAKQLSEPLKINEKVQHHLFINNELSCEDSFITITFVHWKIIVNSHVLYNVVSLNIVHSLMELALIITICSNKAFFSLLVN